MHLQFKCQVGQSAVTTAHVDNASGPADASSCDQDVAAERDGTGRISRYTNVHSEPHMALEEHEVAVDAGTFAQGDDTIVDKWLHPFIVKIALEEWKSGNSIVVHI